MEVSKREVVECPVCYEKVATCVLPCGHSFCADCLAAWLPNLRFQVGTCPLCRCSLSNQSCSWVGALGKDTSTRYSLLCVRARELWSNRPLDREVVHDSYLKEVIDFLPTDHELNESVWPSGREVYIRLAWSQLDPVIYRTTRSTASKKKKMVDVTLTVTYRGRSLPSKVDVRCDNRFTVSCTAYACDILKGALQESNHGYSVCPEKVGLLRGLHAGLSVCVFEARGPYLLEVFHLTLK